MHPLAVSVFRRRGGSESERRGGMLVTGWRSRESLSAARPGESDMASAVQKIKLSPSRDIPFVLECYPIAHVADRATA